MLARYSADGVGRGRARVRLAHAARLAASDRRAARRRCDRRRRHAAGHSRRRSRSRPTAAVRSPLAAFGVGADEWLALRTLTRARPLDRRRAPPPRHGSCAGCAMTIGRCRRHGRSRGARRRAARQRSRRSGRDGRAGRGLRRPIPTSRATRPGAARRPRPERWRATRADPLIAELTSASATRVPARFVARLRELAQLLAGRSQPLVGRRARRCPAAAASRGSRTRAACSSITCSFDRRARASLSHRRADRMELPSRRCARAVAAGRPVRDDSTQRSSMRARLVQSLDPCVACRVEFDDA